MSRGAPGFVLVGQASLVFWCLGVVTAVAAPVFLGHLPSISNLGINDTFVVVVSHRFLSRSLLQWMTVI